VLTHDAQQLVAAQERAAVAAERHGVHELATRIEPLKRFWLAEDYHQKYYLRSDRVLSRELAGIFDGDEDALRESTSAARVNGFIAGGGTSAQLAREIELLGLSEPALTRLASRARNRVGCAPG
jgi:peptide-methionine (S)-S-oxide reductase